MKSVFRNLNLRMLIPAVLLLQGCELENNAPKENAPYYKFTSDDLLWLKLERGDVWVFATASGKEQSYVIEDRKEEIKRSYAPSNFGGIIASNPKVTYYDDRISITIKRLDTLSYNHLEFWRTIPASADDRNPPKGEGEFKIGGIWRTYLGELVSEGVYGNLNIQSSQISPQITYAATIDGKYYDKVIIISTSSVNSLGARKPYIRTIYYAQTEGIVRMVSASGEIWDRKL